jgi:hypothetical protein
LLAEIAVLGFNVAVVLAASTALPAVGHGRSWWMVGARAVEMITAAAHAGTSTIQHAITHLPPSGRRQATAAENAVLSHHNQCESRGRGPRWLVRLDHVADVLAKYPDTAAGVAALRHPMNSQTYCTHTYTLSLTPPPPSEVSCSSEDSGTTG